MEGLPSYAPLQTGGHSSQAPVSVAPAPPVVKAASDAEGDGGAAAASVVKENLVEIRSPIVGTFYRSASPDKPPYIKPGDTIEVGSVVCIVEAMKLFNEIESEVAGKVVKIVAEDASPVEYDQLLFLIDPNG
jgi:acetyl-CoA carboxylase biotin carboxyl carrier protein